MTGVPAPTGWESLDLLSTMPACIADWRYSTPGGHLYLRIHTGAVHNPGRRNEHTTPPRVEMRTGPAGSFGPDLSDPDEVRRFGWDVLRALHAAADLLDGTAPAPPEDPQLSIYDALEATDA